MTCQRTSFTGNAFHVTAIAQNDVGVLVEDGAVGFVEGSGHVCFGHCQAHTVTNPLTQWTCGDFNASGHEVFRMSGSFGSPLTELFDVVDGHAVVAKQVH